MIGCRTVCFYIQTKSNNSHTVNKIKILQLNKNFERKYISVKFLFGVLFHREGEMSINLIYITFFAQYLTATKGEYKHDHLGIINLSFNALSLYFEYCFTNVLYTESFEENLSRIIQDWVTQLSSKLSSHTQSGLFREINWMFVCLFAYKVQ